MLRRSPLLLVLYAACTSGCGGGDSPSGSSTAGGAAGAQSSGSAGAAPESSGGAVNSLGGGATHAGQPGVVSCSSREPNCSAVAFGFCAGIQADEGHCLDWSKLGATACVSPTDCPGLYPTAVFLATATVGPVVAVCIKADHVQSSPDDATSDPGYCAGTQTAIDPSGAASCTNQTCGGSGYCSEVQGTNSTSIVSCTWTL